MIDTFPGGLPKGTKDWGKEGDIKFVIIIIIIMIIVVIQLTYSKTIQEITVEIEPQPTALDFKNLSQYSSRSK